MSKYTTEVRFICENFAGLSESVGFTKVEEVIENSVDKVFAFDFPIFDESYRRVLEKKILKHFYTREIGLETVGLWQLKLDAKMNEIMPYYNKLYDSERLNINPLHTVNKTITHRGSGGSESQSSRTGSSHSTGNNTGWNLYNDTPQGTIETIEDETYLTNATKMTGSNSGDVSNNESGRGTVNSVDEYVDTIVGYDNKVPSELLLQYRETFLNIDMMIIDDLEELFMQLW